MPYSGVKTHILILNKKLAKERDNVLFIDLHNDGYTLTAQRNKIDGSEIPETIEVFKKFINNLDIDSTLATIVNKETILENENISLSINTYKKKVKAEIQYDPEDVIINKIKQLNDEYQELLHSIEDE